MLCSGSTLIGQPFFWSGKASAMSERLLPRRAADAQQAGGQPAVGNVSAGGRITAEKVPLTELNRITADPEVMGGKPCIRGLRVTVGTVVGLVAAGHSHGEILRLYPYLEADDIPQALEYGAWRSAEIELPSLRP